MTDIQKFNCATSMLVVVAGALFNAMLIHWGIC